MEHVATTPTKPRVFFTPTQKELFNALKKAVCDTYEMTEDEFLNSENRTVAGVRFYCFLLMSRAGIENEVIAAAFNKVRSTIRHGISQADFQIRMMRHRAQEVAHISRVANEYPKKFEWHIH